MKRGISTQPEIDNADHYLTIEDAVTVGAILLEYLGNITLRKEI